MYLLMAGSLWSLCAPVAAIPAAGITWLVAGGLFYTIGVVFYALIKNLFTAMRSGISLCWPQYLSLFHDFLYVE